MKILIAVTPKLRKVAKTWFLIIFLVISDDLKLFGNKNCRGKKEVEENLKRQIPKPLIINKCCVYDRMSQMICRFRLARELLTCET